jgi:6-phosphofructokinase 2
VANFANFRGDKEFGVVRTEDYVAAPHLIWIRVLRSRDRESFVDELGCEWPAMPLVLTLTMNPALDIATATDIVVPTEKLRCSEPRYDPGGGGINVARAVQLLGGQARAIFPAGGMSGAMFCDLLKGEDVPHTFVPIAGITRESLAVVERQTGKQYRFLLPGPVLSARDQERCLDTLATYARGASFVVASGSLPPGVPDDFYARVALLAQTSRVRFVLDTSGRALAAAGNDVFLLKTSLRELEQLAETTLRTDQEEESAARHVIGTRRAHNLVVSLGSRGALLADKLGTRRFPAVPVKAVGSVGAGDGMVAGIVLSLVRGLTLPEAVRFGMAAGAAALLRPGTELCRREDTERLFDSVCAAHGSEARSP